jgi:hypothetical protein
MAVLPGQSRSRAPPKLARIEYTLTVDTDEGDRRLALLHQNLMKCGIIYNTVAAATDLTGTIRAAWLIATAEQVQLCKYRKHPRGPKKPPVKRTHDPRRPHVSVARLLALRQQAV